MWRTLVRRHQRLRPRLGDRRLPVRARRPGAAPQRPPLPEGGVRGHRRRRAAHAPDRRPRTSVAAEDRAASSRKAPVHIVLLVRRDPLAGPDARPVLHLAAAAGGRSNTTGWWKVFSQPSLRDLEELRPHLPQHRASPHALLDRRRDRDRRHGASDPRRRARRPTRSRGSSSRAATGSSSLVIALLVVPLQMALIPIFSLYNKLGPVDTVFGLILFHTAFALPFAIFLLRNFFIGIPKDILESARIDGASECADLLPADPAARPAGDRVARDLPVPLDVERPARRARRSAATRSRSRSRSSRSCASSATNIDMIAPAAFLSLDRSRWRCSSRSSATSCRDCWPARSSRCKKRAGTVRDRRRRARRASSRTHPQRRRARAGRNRRVRDRTRTRRRVAAAGARDPAAAHALGERRPLPAAPRSRVSRCGRPCGGGRPGRSSRRSSTATTRRVDEFLEHVEEVRDAHRLGRELPAGARIARIRATDGGLRPRRARASSRTCCVAPGHPGLHVPEELAGDPRVVHAYEPHEYADEVAVVGAGMAAATEWLNALAAGAEVVSVRRREPARRPLNLPRELFTRRGLDGYHATAPEERVAAAARAGSRRPTRPAAPGTSRSSAQPARGASA